MKYRLPALVLAVIIVFWTSPVPADAHAVLVDSYPASNSALDTAPEEIRLTFNERVERALADLRITDRNGKEIRLQAASENQGRTLTAQLPALKDGWYMVSYRVLSADGHPIASAFVFRIGDPPADGVPLRDDAEHHGGHLHGSGIDAQTVIFYAARVWFFAAMLILGGLNLWKLLHAWTPEAGRRLRRLTVTAQRNLLLAVLVYAGLELPQLLPSFRAEDWLALAETGIGQARLAELLLAVISFALLGKNRFADAAWTIAFLAAESAAGHASSAARAWAAMAADFAHLTAAALWTAGLLLLIAQWRRHKQDALAFMPAFSGAALASVAALAVTGAIIALQLLPSPEYVTFTIWGRLLVAKIAAVLLVVLTAALIRMRLRKNTQGGRVRALLWTDLGLAALITGIAAVFTTLQPVPSNEPLYWHEMGEEAHMTLEIAPNEPGMNDISLSVWLPDDQAEPGQVTLRLLSADSGLDAPIDVPLVSRAPTDDTDWFPGFLRHDYSASGPFLPHAGEWQAEVRVVDGKGTEFVYRKSFRLY